MKRPEDKSPEQETQTVTVSPGLIRFGRFVIAVVLPAAFALGGYLALVGYKTLGAVEVSATTSQRFELHVENQQKKDESQVILNTQLVETLKGIDLRVANLEAEKKRLEYRIEQLERSKGR